MKTENQNIGRQGVNSTDSLGSDYESMSVEDLKNEKLHIEQILKHKTQSNPTSITDRGEFEESDAKTSYRK